MSYQQYGAPTYPPQPQAPLVAPFERPADGGRPRGRRRGLGRFLIPAGTGLVGLVVGVGIGTSGSTPTAAGPAPTITVFASATSEPAAVASAALTKADVKLTVREVEKKCYGTAGCHVQYRLDASTGKTIAAGDSYEVTYSVKGLDDEAVGTLTLEDDGTFRQDSYQAGDKARSSTKLTAVVTDVRKVL